MTLEVACQMCGTTHYVRVPDADYYKWVDGALIQDAMPYLEPEVRELLISRTCGSCFDKLFPEEEV